mgnify:FL=1
MGIISPQMVVGAIIATVVGGYVLHCEYVKNDRAQFIATLEAQAEEQKRKIKQQIKDDKLRKENADAENKRTTDALRVTIKRLRDQRAGASFVPPASSAAKRPDRATFDRAELERALQRLDDGVSGIVEEGDQARIDLDTAKRWSNSVLRLRLSQRLTPPS